MAGGAESGDAAKLTGLSKIFNSTTISGRANVRTLGGSLEIPKFSLIYLVLQVAKATYATIGLLVLFLSLKPKKK